MTSTSNESVSHWVRWDGDHPKFTCNGDENAPCHNFPECECEEGSGAAHGVNADPGHESISHERDCWVLTWLNHVDPGATYADGDQFDVSVPRHDARIDWEWDGDGMYWTYHDPDLNGVRDVDDDDALCGCGDRLSCAECMAVSS